MAGNTAVQAADADADKADLTLEEIVVTANKRTENLSDVAMSVRAIGGEEIDARGLQGMGDYLTSVPSIAYNERGGGRNQITIRGITTGALAADPNTVGYYFGDVPVSATARGNPDLKLFDVERVEILRGPQGTLYGAGSMGGTIKVVPAGAKLNEVEGTVEGVISKTRYGGTNYSGAGAVNVPIAEDKMAVRLVAYGYENTGYVDNVASGATAYGIPDKVTNNVASETTKGGRFAMKIQATEKLSLDTMIIVQNQNVDGLPEVSLPDGGWTQNRWRQEDLNDDFRVYNLVANYEGDAVNLTASTAYVERDWNQLRDIHALGLFAFLPDAPLQLYDGNEEKFWVHEARLSSNTDSKFQWLAGGFLLDKKLDFSNGLQWFGSAQSIEDSLLGVLFGATKDMVLHARNNTHNANQYALFGEASYQFTEKLKATLGLRWFKFTDDRELAVSGIFSNSTDLLTTSADTFNPKVALNYTPNDDHLYYVSATKGFRPGNPNNPLPDACTADLKARGFDKAPDGTTPDSLWSYEAGTKLSLADGRVALNGAVFYIDWKNIPTSYILPCGFSFGFNADTATSKGLEVELAAQISSNWRLDIGGAYTDAHLDASFNPDTGELRNEGGQTPGVPELTLGLGTDYSFELAGRWASMIRLDAQYVGGYYNFLPSEAVRQRAGDYATVNLRWNTDFNGLNFELFANNLFNETVNIVVDTEFTDGRTYRGRPRTIGARVRYQF
ncbi:TonB-dependent receptor [Gimibacter soli]|uniref:TonB-dependent receptor n=1 Tax=Gimibacter soli TaxID=3024400 RepID=A0AAE9XSQ8_9PROT|nr:TonB-dependent receptor [Gimibacter soli]WCL55579.1 TonB-dependent receptor [Gimibacter soli]